MHDVKSTKNKSKYNKIKINKQINKCKKKATKVYGILIDTNSPSTWEVGYQRHIRGSRQSSDT